MYTSSLRLVTKRIIYILLLFLCIKGSSQSSEGIEKLNGTSLFIKVMGKGEPLLIIHGIPGLNHSYFLPHLKKLSEKYKLIFFDQRACGLSALPSVDSLSLPFFIDDIEAIRQASGEAQLNILAHSWGAIPAINYGIRYPDKVKSLILCSPVPFSKEYDEEIRKAQLLRMTDQDSTDQSIIKGSLDFKNNKPEAYRKLILFSFRHSFYDPSNLSKLQIFVPSNYVAAGNELSKGLSKDLVNYNYYPHLHSFSFPVLIMHGASDVLPLAAAKQTMESIRYSSMVIFNKSGHFIFIEEPKKFLKTVSGFLE